TACGPSATPGVQPSASPVASSSTAAEGAFPREVTIPKQVVTAEQTITLEERPSSIVVLAPALTETVYAVGAGDQVKAVDKLSTYPPDAKTTDLDAFSPNVEAVAGMEPDLVLVSNDQGGIVGQLQKLKIPVVVLEAPADLEHAYAQVEQVGELTGHEQEAAEPAAPGHARRGGAGPGAGVQRPGRHRRPAAEAQDPCRGAGGPGRPGARLRPVRTGR